MKFRSQNAPQRQRFTCVSDERGFSLIEALVSVAILTTGALVSATLIGDMAKQSAQVKRSLARSNFEQQLVALYRNNDLCSCNMGTASGGALQIPVGGVNITSLKQSCSAATPDFFDASAAGGYQIEPGLKVAGISVSDPQLISGNSYSATMTVSYQDAGTYVPLRPAKFVFLFEKTAAAGPPYNVTTCTVGGAISAASGGSGWTLTGNSGTDPNLDFFGTIDNKDVVFRRNSLIAGALRSDSASWGSEALKNSAGAQNTAVGALAMAGNTTGQSNVAIGYAALAVNPTGSSNVAIGARALSYGGSANVAVGSSSMMKNDGSENVAIGTLALTAKGAGSQNSSLGHSTLIKNTSGNQNIAIGYSALSENLTGTGNIAIGAFAGGHPDHSAYWQSEGSDNIFIGRDAGPGTNASLSNAIAIGKGAVVSQSNSLVLGAQGAGKVNVGIGTTAPAHRLHIFEDKPNDYPKVWLENPNASGGIMTTLRSDGAFLESMAFGSGAGGFTGGISNAGSNHIMSSGRTIIGTQNNSPLYFMTTDAVRMTVTESGNVGIGTITPTYQFQLSNDSAAKPGSATWTVASDERLKDVRAKFTRGLASLEGIDPVYYRYKAGNPLNLPSEKEFVGVLAQATAKAVPEAVAKDEQGYLHVSSDSIIWTMLNAIKELFHKWKSDSESLHLELQNLKIENTRLHAENRLILDRLKRLEENLPRSEKP